MSMRESLEVQTSRPEVVLSGPPVTVVIAGPPTSRRSPVLVLAAVLVIATLGAGAAVLLGGDDDSLAQPAAQPPAAVPGPPAALQMSVAAPATARAGEPVELTVSYSDGSGIFSGTSEEWGDGAGTSSVRQGRCTAADAAPGALTDTYRLSHSWATPGTYAVVLGVRSFSCRGTTALQESSTETVTVRVLAR